ncbi:MAG: tetratricopeptide repeat protein [Cyclobacteriaceae bacterium]
MARRYKVKQKPKATATDEAKQLIEDPDALVEQFSKTEVWIQRNKLLVFGVLGLIFAAVAGYFGYNYYVTNLDKEAQVEIFSAVFYFEADSLDKALNGDGRHFGLLDIIEDYGNTKTGNLAQFYAGAAYLKKGEFQTAIDHLNEFNGGDFLVQARAYALIGDAYMELGNYTDASEYYDKAANYQSNDSFTPGYLLKAALAYEKQSDYTAAKSRYEQVMEDYFDSSEYQIAQKQKARLEGLTSP